MSHLTKAIKKHYLVTKLVISFSIILIVFTAILISQSEINLIGLNGVILLITSLLLITSIFAYYHYSIDFKSKITVISQLEKWADLSKVVGKIQPLPDSDNHLVCTIKVLFEQLQEAQNIDSHFDRKLRGKALLDRQTGVGNREFFNNRLEALLKEDDIQGAVYFIHFKEGDLVHALYGEQQTITLLELLISNLKYSLRSLPSYFIARRSEFEIALIIPGLFFTEAEKLAGTIVKSLSTVPLPVGINKEEFIHIGVSYFSQAENSYQIKSEADMALRSAQLQGPSQWFMYDPGEVEHENAKGSLKWRTFLTNAIRKNLFVIFFQPVISEDNETVLHHEVLSKVRDSDGSLINARVFFPMAKKCGLSEAIDLLVFEQVCRVLIYEKTQKDDCSINLSIESLLSKNFIEKLTTLLNNNKIIAKRIIIEISEYQLVSHLDQLAPILNLLHQLGVRFLADKVGQYIESAQYVKACPISFMKLHRSIVLNIHLKPENQLFIQSLKIISDANQVEIYALGVENSNEWDTLLRLGVNGGQGHFFTEPVAQMAKAIQLP